MKRTALVILLAVWGLGAKAQGTLSEVKINEVMVYNQTNYIDHYGERLGWIELFNTGHSVVDLAGAYLTVKEGSENLTYRIPQSEQSKMGPRSYRVFFCDGNATKGVFHTNFTLDQTGYIALLTSSGQVVTSVRYEVADQLPDVSVGWKAENGKEVFGQLDAATPGATNELLIEVPKHELFRRNDPYGTMMSITAMVVVFSALTVLFILFALFGKGMVWLAKKRSEQQAELLSKSPKGNAFSGEEQIAAIAMALAQYQREEHDRESTILTINRVARAYSPWNSKIYGLRQIPEKRNK